MVFFLPYETHQQHHHEDFADTVEGGTAAKLMFLFVLELKSQIYFRI